MHRSLLILAIAAAAGTSAAAAQDAPLADGPGAGQEGLVDGGATDVPGKDEIAGGEGLDGGDEGEEGASDEEWDEEEYTTVVTASEQAGKDATSDTTTVKGEELIMSPRPSVLEALSQTSSGIYVTGKGTGVHGVASGASGAIMMRGLGGSPNTQVLIVENGAPDYQGIFGHPIPDAYVPFLIDEVLVIKGGDSVLYGTNAMGGVIVIEDRFLEYDGFELLTDLGAGSFKTLEGTAALLASKGRWKLASSFGMFTTDGHRAGTDGSSVVGQIGGRWRPIEGLDLEIRAKVLHVEGGDPGPVSHPYTDHWFDVWRTTVTMKLDYEHPVFDLTFVPHANIGVHRLYDGFHSVDVVAGGTVEADVRIVETLRLLLGIGAEGVDGIVEDRIEMQSTAIDATTALFFYNQLTWTPLRGLSFVAGTREMYSTAYGFVFLFKGGGTWTPTEGFTVRARIAKNFRQPTLRELYLPYPTANPDLEHETSLNADLGFEIAKEHVETSVTWYRTDARNMIKYFGSWPSAEVVNIDHLVIYGIEAHLGIIDLGPVGLHLGADFRDVGRYTRQNPSSKYNFTIEAGHSFGPHTVEGSLSGEWVRGLFSSNYGRDPIDDVFFMDLSVRYRFTIPDRLIAIEPYLHLRNITNNSYAYIEEYVMPGFNLAAGVRVSL